MNVTILCECERIQAELDRYGFNAYIAPLPVDKPELTDDEPEDFTVAVYMPHLPQHEHEKYAMPFMLRLFQSLS